MSSIVESNLRLRKHVYLCFTNHHAVFLDLKSDKYLCLIPEHARQLCLALGFPQPEDFPGRSSAQGTDSDFNHLIQEMISNNLLTENTQEGKKTQPVTLERPTYDLMGHDFGLKPKINLRHIFNFFYASLISQFHLHFTSLEKIIKNLKKRKIRRAFRHTSPDSEDIRELLEIFRSLRPLVFTAKNHCLYDSLSLIEFMARYNYYPTWVFGVKVGPFEAHCWIQEGKILLNDSIDYTTFFTPIMTV